MEKVLIGRKDKADLPEFTFENIIIKIDTGAYTSSIHCKNVREIKTENHRFIEFTLLDDSFPEYSSILLRTTDYKIKTIKNSFGTSEERFIIKTNIRIFNTEYPIELSLSDRENMKHPILLGRKFLKGKFLVDVSKKNISYNQKRKLI